jgi:integrase
MRAKLTKTAIEGAKIGTSRTFIWDAGDGAVKGFGLKIESSGKKIFVYQYRMGGGRRAVTKRYTIGELSTALTVARAREIAEGLEVKVRSAIDPLGEARAKAEQERARAAIQNNRVEVVVADYLKAIKRRKKRLRSYDRMKTYFEHYVTGTDAKAGPWAGKVISEVTGRDVRDVLRTLARKGRVASTRHVLALLRPFFDYAISQELRRDNPALGIRLKDFGHTLQGRDRHLSPMELRAVWLAADEMEYPFGAFFKLLILTGQRRNEVAGMRWSELEPNTVTPWKIPSDRSKNGIEHTVALSAQALTVIAALPEMGKDLLFTTNGKNPISGFSKAKQYLDKDSGVGGEDGDAGWRLHDLRRTFATIAAEVIKVPPHVIDKVLSHKSGAIKGIVAVYQKAEFLEEREVALNAWGLYVETLAKTDGSEAAKKAGKIASDFYRTEVLEQAQQPVLRIVSGAVGGNSPKNA